MSFILPNLNEIDLSFKMDLDFSDCFEGKNYNFLNNLKVLDPSYKMDLDFWDHFGRKKMHLITKLKKRIFVTFCLSIYMTKLFKNGVYS